MDVYYPRNLPGYLVVNEGGIIRPWAVPMRMTGWAERRPYLGHSESLTPVPSKAEADIQLRSTGWVP